MALKTHLRTISKRTDRYHEEKDDVKLSYPDTISNADEQNFDVRLQTFKKTSNTVWPAPLLRKLNASLSPAFDVAEETN